MNNVIPFPTNASRLWAWAEEYTDILSEHGNIAAGKYFSECVPEDLWDKVTPLVERVFLRRGLDAGV